MTTRTLQNYVGGRWVDAYVREKRDVVNPANGETIAHVPLCGREEVDAAVTVAAAAFPAWRQTPPVIRARHLFTLKYLMERDFDNLAQTIVREEGKTLDDARGEVRRGIESVEVACGIPTLMQGNTLEDVSRGIDTDLVRQPIGVFGIIPPFNFPLMVPLWFIPFAVACGNCIVVKPSEQVPMSQVRLFELIEEANFPDGVLNLVNGAREVVDALIEHPQIKGISFVGSAPVARQVYARAASYGKRAQCLGGAKNFMVVMPDADLDKAVDGIMSSAFGAAGERCLAGSVVVAVGGVASILESRLVDAAKALRVGDGLHQETQMGPLVSRPHRERVLGYIAKGVEEGATLALDGRTVTGLENTPGSFVGPTLFTNVSATMTIGREEIFGPVLSVMRADDLDTALALVNGSRFGNAAAIFTTSGAAARRFKYDVQCGMVGVNVGVPAPMAMFTFTGWKDSFFGHLHENGRDCVEFYTAKKVVISRW